MYIPDHTIVRRLRDYDPLLSVKWIPRRERWGIYRTVPGGNNLYDRQCLIKIVCNDDRSYRPLDSRAITHLQKHDMHRLSEASFNAFHDDIEKSTIEAQERERASFLDDTNQISKDIAGAAIEEMEDGIGSVNIPKEDIYAQTIEDYGVEEADKILS